MTYQLQSRVAILAMLIVAAATEVFWRVRRPNRPMAAIRSGRWKLLLEGDLARLFDLEADPGERTDRAAENPDRVATLRRLFAEWADDVDRKAAAGERREGSR